MPYYPYIPSGTFILEVGPSGATPVISGGLSAATGATGSAGIYAASGFEVVDNFFFAHTTGSDYLLTGNPTNIALATGTGYVYGGDIRGTGDNYQMWGTATSTGLSSEVEHFVGAYARYTDAAGKTLTGLISGGNGYYTGSYTTLPVLQEFNTILPDIDTGNLGNIATGSGVHLYKDVTLTFSEITDRAGNQLTTQEELENNLFFDGFDIDILNTTGGMVFTGYKSGVKSRTFAFTEQENINVFGAYQADFGVRYSLQDQNGREQVNEVYVYGNPLEISHLYITDASGRFLSQSNDSNFITTGSGADELYLTNRQYVTGTPTTGGINVEFVFASNPNFVEMGNSVKVYGQTGSAEFTRNSDNYLATISLTENKAGQTYLLQPKEGIEVETDYYFQLEPESAIAKGKVITVGPHKIVPVLQNPRNAGQTLYDRGNQYLLGDLDVSGCITGRCLTIQTPAYPQIIDTKGGNVGIGTTPGTAGSDPKLMVQGNIQGTGIGYRATGPGGLPYLLTGDAGGGAASVTLQTATDNGSTTTTDITIGSASAATAPITIVTDTNTKSGIDVYADGDLGNKILTIKADANSAGELSVKDTAGVDSVKLSNTSSRGQMDLYDDGGVARMTALVDSNEQGELTLKDSSANNSVKLYSDASKNAIIDVSDAAGTTKISLDTNASNTSYINTSVGVGTSVVEADTTLTVVGIGSTAPSLVVRAGIGTTAGFVGIGTTDPQHGLDASTIASANIGAANSYIYSTGSAIIGGADHIISGDYDVIAGGAKNDISGGEFNFVGGGSGVCISASDYSSSIGGFDNDIGSSSYSVIVGGYNNLISGIGGGGGNSIVGGFDNKISGTHTNDSFLGAGRDNKLSGTYTFIGAGATNTCYADNGVLVGGVSNEVHGNSASILGGADNIVSGAYSYAFGRKGLIKAAHDGAAVLADGQNRDHGSSGEHTLNLDFASGVYIGGGGALYVSGNSVSTGSAAEADTLQTVTDRGNTTTTSIAVQGQYLSGVSGVFDTVDITGAATLTVTGNVGIGTNAPTVNGLDVVGTGIFGLGGALATDYSMRVGYNPSLGGGGASQMGLWNNGGGKMWLKGYADTYIGYDKFVTIKDGGNVGIGTTAPSGLLHVDGEVTLPSSLYFRNNAASIQVGSSWNTSVLSFLNGATTYLEFDVPNSRVKNNLGKYLTASSTAAQFGTLDGYDTTFVVSGVEKMRIDTDGNVGIGTASPSELLTLRGAASTLLLDSVTNESSLKLKNTSTECILKAANADFVTMLGGVERTRISSSGYVGIGTATPSGLLHVDERAGASFATNYGIISDINGGANSTNIAGYFSSTTASDNIALKTVGRHIFGGNIRVAGGYIDQRSDRDSQMGNIFVGDTTAGYIAGNGGTIVFAGDSVSQGIANSTFASIRGVKENGSYNTSLGALVFGTQDDAGASQQLDSVSEKMRITSTGYVGIGTTAPLAKFDVRGDISGSGSFLGTGIGNRITNNGTPYLLSGDSPAETQTLQDVTDNGNTTTNSIISTGPHISGGTGFFDLIRAEDGTIECASNMMMIDPDVAYKYIVGANWAAGYHTNALSALHLYLGAGVDSPDVKLTRDAANVLALRNDGNAQQFNIYNTYSSSTDYERAAFEWDSDVFAIDTQTGSAGGAVRSLDLRTSGQSALYIDSGTQNVGIGTNDPTKKLEVVGDISGQSIFLDAGNSSDMAIQFAASNNGIYCDPVSQMRFAVDGASSAIVLSSNNIQFGAGGHSALSWYTNTYMELNGGGTKAHLNAYGLGVGTTDPLAMLDVRGDISGSGNFLGTGIGNRITNNGTPYLLSGDSPAETQTLQDVTTNGNTTTTSILSTGPHISGVTGLFSDKVGIGTSAPSYDLEIVGVSPTLSLKSTQEDSDPKIIFSDYAQTLGFEMWYDGNTEDMYFDNHYTANSDTVFRTHVSSSPVEVLRLTDDGKVGIGTGSPAYKLHVNSTTTDEVARFQSSDRDAFISIADNATTGYLGVDGAYPTLSLGFDTDMASSSNLSINTDGYVGIGTRTPTSQIHIQSQTGSITVGSLNTKNAALDTYYGETDPAGDIVGTYHLQLAHLTENGTTSFRSFWANQRGNYTDVGIVNSGPQIGFYSEMQVHQASHRGTISNQYCFRGYAGISSCGADGTVTNAYGLHLEMLNNDSDGTVTNSYGVYINDTDTAGASSNRWGIYSEGPATKNYFEGAIGIGTTSPTSPLEVKTSFGGDLLRLNTTTIGDLLFSSAVEDGRYVAKMATTSSSLDLMFHSSSARCYFSAGQKVGIGTNAPTVQLDVIGTGIFSEKVGIGTTPTNALDVVGHLSATSKSFVIDHPTKENKKLQYGSLEGPEHGVFVRGTTNKNVIKLPDYWKDLVHEDSITVTLTPVHSFQSLYVKSKTPEHIMVGGVKKSYDYVVYGERKDIDKLEVEPPRV